MISTQVKKVAKKEADGDAPGVELVRRFAGHLATTCVEIKFRAPTPSTRCCLRSCVCSMAWGVQAIDASARWRGGSNDLTRWLISTQLQTDN